MSIVRDEVIYELLDKKTLKLVKILEFVKNMRRPVTIDEVEKHYMKEIDTSKDFSLKHGKDRKIDNTVRNFLRDLEKKGLLEELKDKAILHYTLGEKVAHLGKKIIDGTEINNLIRWAVTLKKYQGLTFYDEMIEMIEETCGDDILMEELKNPESRPVIEFETSSKIYTGWGLNVDNHDITQKVAENLAFFYRVITLTNETVKFRYRTFQTGEDISYSHVEPYFLKEHNKRWYLVGKPEGKNYLQPFSLDRIIEIAGGKDHFVPKRYVIDESFDPVAYWKDCIGIYRGPEDTAEEVTFELKDGKQMKNVQYLISLPMHHSQRASKVDGTWTKFRYKVIIGPEIVRQMRQWGLDNIRSIDPERLNEMVREW
jgi:hypothetical protein